MNVMKVAKARVITVARDSTLAEAAKLMRECHVGSVVAVNRMADKPVPVGIVTDRDIVMSTIALNLTPADFTVEDLMAPTLHVARADQSIFEVITLMKEKGIRRVPLVHSDGSLAGIVSAADALEFLEKELAELRAIPEKMIQNERRVRRAF